MPPARDRVYNPFMLLRPPAFSRRAFMTTAVMAVPLLATPVAALAGSLEQRSVSFVHTHTGEQLTTT